MDNIACIVVPNIGIRENNEFSVCFPTKSILPKTDYCGVFSGHNIDKSNVFSVQYGKLKNAPIIRECNICFSCKVTEIVPVKSYEVYFGQVVEHFAHPSVLSNGQIDFDKVKPVIFGPGRAYNSLSSTVGIPENEHLKYKRSV